jgi:chemotaxis protein methyltransferase CheR
MLDDAEFRRLLDYFNRPWSGFRKVRKGVKKRIRRHMASLGCSTVDGYLARLAQDREARAACESCLRVTISRFFRDRQLWQTLQKSILPDLAARFPPPIRIWSAGCAGGEEAYSLAMAWREMALPTEPDLLATDADRTGLQRANAGAYPPSSLKEMPVALRDKYFEPGRGGRRFIIFRHRLPPIRWRRHDLLDPPPEGGAFHLILLRNNLFTYYRGNDLETALKRILSVLAKGGYLVTGSHEHLPGGDFGLTRCQACPWIYRLAASAA